MTRTDSTPRCPACHEDRLVEFDTTLRVFVCLVCAHQWRIDANDQTGAADVPPAPRAPRVLPC